MLPTETRISFEFFPPKTSEGIAQLTETAVVLSYHQPQFFSVTCGAGGTSRTGTLHTVKTLQSQLRTISIAPHLACIGASQSDIKNLLEEYKQLNIKRIVALRGDRPLNLEHAGEFEYACELVELIRKQTGRLFHIEVAAYPEVHPQANNFQNDVLNLKRKFEAGADSALTQFFFNPDAYFYFRDACGKAGIFQPIVPGIMPITQFANLVRFSDTCGAEIPRWIRKRLESYAGDLASIKAFGIEIVSNLCHRLLNEGAPGLHFYTLNKADGCIKLIEQLGLIDAHQLQPSRELRSLPV